jgi:hypothetical protein
MLLRVIVLWFLEATMLVVEQSMPQNHVNISAVEAVPTGAPTTRTTAVNNPLSPLSPSAVSSLHNISNIGAATTTTTNEHSPSSSVATLTIPCQWENYDGTLTANAKGLVFTGSYFFFATILSLPWTDVRRMMQYHHYHDDGAAAPTTGRLVVTMRNNNNGEPEKQEHVFLVQLFSPAQLSRLMQLQNEALIALRRLAAVVVRDDLAACTSSSSSSSSSGSTMTSETSSRSTTPLPSFLDEREDDGTEAVVDKKKNSPVTATASCFAGVTISCSAPTTTVARTSIVTTAADKHWPNAAIIELHTGLPLAFRPINVTHDDLQGRLYVGPKGLVFTGRRRYFYFWDDHALLVLPWSNIWRLHRPDNQTVLLQSSHHHHDVSSSSSQLKRDYRFFLNTDEDDDAADENDDAAAVVQDEIWETLVSCHNAHLTETHDTTMMALPTPPPVSEIDRPGETTVAGGAEQKHVVTAAPAHAQQTTISTSILTADNTTLSKPMQHLVVSDVIVPCSLDRFEDLFLRDDAPYSLGDFLAARGDSDVQSSKWDNDDENNKVERVVRYLHPVNVPMAPPQARARKEQRLVRRRRPSWPGDDDASTSIIVETKTIVDDVPMTDCFYVLDRLTVTEQQKGEVIATTDNLTTTTTVVVQVRMEFEITFVKSTMFRGIIEKTTRQEFIGLFQSLVEYYVQCLVDPESVRTLASVPGATAETALTTAMESSSRPNADINYNNKSNPVAPLYVLLWAVTCLLQLWILRELRELKKAASMMTVAKF